MRKQILGLLFISVVAASCGESAAKDEKGKLNDKKAELAKLEKEQQQNAEKIASLKAEIEKADPAAAAANNAKLVFVDTLNTQDFRHFIELQGRVDATNISYVAPPNGQGGVVKALYVTQGQQVRKGQVLARLDDALIRQQIEPLRVQLAAAEDTYRRTQNLWSQGIGAYQNVLQAQTQVETLKKQIALIQKQASQMVVTAPQAGVADQVNVRVGEIFTGATMTGQQQIRIVNTGNLKVVAAVPENFLGRVNVGSKLQIVLPEQNNRQIEATVNVVQKVIDPNTRAFNIEARIPADANMKPNQLAQIRILDYSAPDVIVIPVNTVQSDENGKYVYVMEKQGDKLIALRKTVMIGESFAGGVEVKSGLKPGDQLITEGFQNLYEGQVVTVAKK